MDQNRFGLPPSRKGFPPGVGLFVVMFGKIKGRKFRPENVHFSRREYAEYLASAEWAALRAQVLSWSTARTCRYCLNPSTEVHHLTYRHIVDVHSSDLVAVCGACHRRIHALVKRGVLRLDGWQHPSVLHLRTKAALANPVALSTKKAAIDRALAERIANSDCPRRIAGILKVTIYGPESAEGVRITAAQRIRIERLIERPKFTRR